MAAVNNSHLRKLRTKIPNNAMQTMGTTKQDYEGNRQVLNDAICDVYEAWNELEADLKMYESLESMLLVIAINEMRYAGHKILEGLYEYQKNDPDMSEIKRSLVLAKANLERGSEDVFDATFFVVSRQLSNLLGKKSGDALEKAYPHFRDTLETLHEAKSLVAESRSNPKNRSHIYRTLRRKHARKLIETHNKLRFMEMTLDATKPKRESYFQEAAWATVIAVLGTTMAIISTLIASL